MESLKSPLMVTLCELLLRNLFEQEAAEGGVRGGALRMAFRYFDFSFF